MGAIADGNPLIRPTLFKAQTIMWGLFDAYRNNKISSLVPVSGFSKLEEPYLEDNEVQDIGPIAGLTGLQRIDLDLNEIGDISSVAGPTNLELLSACANQIGSIRDIQPLVDNAGLGSGDEVDIRWNPLDLTPGSGTMQNISTLIARGVNLKYGLGKSLESPMDALSLTVGFEQNLSSRRVD